MGSGQIHLEPLKSLNVRVCLSDHTGSLENCRLSGKFAEQTLGCDVSMICFKWAKCFSKYLIKLNFCCRQKRFSVKL